MGVDSVAYLTQLAQPNHSRVCVKTLSELQKWGENTKNAVNIGRCPYYCLIISSKWENKYPIGKIPGFSHSLADGWAA